MGNVLEQARQQGCGTADGGALRSAFGRFATGVAIVTASADTDVDVGVTINSFNSLSLDPPLILWSLRLSAASIDVFRRAEYFGINILSETQDDLCRRFASPIPDRFSGVDRLVGMRGIPLIGGALAHIQCRTWTRYPGGDHEIFVGQVIDFGAFNGEPLVFHGGRVRKLRPAISSMEGERS
jgi:flavin reductase (DIM6/NTAB) family NADH-FMN oxidoreductase RutF